MRNAIWSALTSALLAFAVSGCGGDSSDTTTLSGTLTKSGVADGTYAYLKLVAQGAAVTSTTLFWTRSTAFSSGHATYALADIKHGVYTGYAFIDVNGNAAGNASSMPDSGDWGTNGGQNFDMSKDQTGDLPEQTWIQMP